MKRHEHTVRFDRRGIVVSLAVAVSVFAMRLWPRAEGWGQAAKAARPPASVHEILIASPETFRYAVIHLVRHALLASAVVVVMHVLVTVGGGDADGRWRS